jgi:hypothetical protein
MLLQDPVTRTLLANSQLTTPQLETLLTDSISTGIGLGKSVRPFYRPSRGRISRGAYNRTLIQAQNNIIRSIYTILLLGYLGLFDSAALQPFLELADTIDSYVREIRAGDTHLSIAQLNARLLEYASALAKRQSFKDKLKA